jgi:hypothetical protein
VARWCPVPARTCWSPLPTPVRPCAGVGIASSAGAGSTSVCRTVPARDSHHMPRGWR